MTSTDINADEKCSSPPGLYISVYRLSLRSLVFEILGEPIRSPPKLSFSEPARQWQIQEGGGG